jgi:hypothetical protein
LRVGLKQQQNTEMGIGVSHRKSGKTKFQQVYEGLG